MQKIFTVGEGFTVPDGTIVHPAVDAMLASRACGTWVDDVSIALGKIPAGVTSNIHVHPVVAQVTWVLSGALTITMKDRTTAAPYHLELTANQSVWTQPGTFFQLSNPHRQPCRVLYIVTPAFLFEVDAHGNVAYNDAIVLEQDWDTLARAAWKIPQLAELHAVQHARTQATTRMQQHAK